jgi:hypothetical protein
MHFTAFFPFFFFSIVYSLFGPKRWAYVIGITCFFQASSPILLMAGGRISGIAPSYLIMLIGLVYMYIVFYNNKKRLIKMPSCLNSAMKVLMLFTIVGVVGALVLPRIFEGTGVRVLTSRGNGGIDGMFAAPLVPKGTNYIQAFYLLSNFLMCFMIKLFVSENIIEKTDIVKGIIVGACLSLCLGFYQIIAHYSDLPWPDNVINSNFGQAQLFAETVGGLPRISSTFQEASVFAMHFLGVLGFFGLGLQKRFFAMIALVALVLSTSSTAYFGLLGLFFIWAILDIPRRAKKAFLTAFVILICMAIAIVWDYEMNGGSLIEGMVFNKFEGSSGKARMNAEAMALDTFVGTWGLGAGVGSMRCSSLFTTLLATTGAPGVLLFGLFLWLLLHSSLRSSNELDQAISWGLIGLIIGWSISVPDIANPLFWVLVGLMPGGRRVVSSRAPALV